MKVTFMGRNTGEGKNRKSIVFGVGKEYVWQDIAQNQKLRTSAVGYIPLYLSTILCREFTTDEKKYNSTHSRSQHYR
jgi:hypothetical protein